MVGRLALGLACTGCAFASDVELAAGCSRAAGSRTGRGPVEPFGRVADRTAGPSRSDGCANLYPVSDVDATTLSDLFSDLYTAPDANYLSDPHSLSYLHAPAYTYLDTHAEIRSCCDCNDEKFGGRNPYRCADTDSDSCRYLDNGADPNIDRYTHSDIDSDDRTDANVDGDRCPNPNADGYDDPHPYVDIDCRTHPYSNADESANLDGCGYDYIGNRGDGGGHSGGRLADNGHS